VTRFYFEFHRRTSGFLGGYLHDPLAAVAVAEPALLKCRRGYVSVESKGEYARGLSIFFSRLDPRRNAELPEWVKRTIAVSPSVRVAESVNAGRFRQEFLRVLRSRRR